MQSAIIDFLEVERERVFDASLNIDGYDFTDSTLVLDVRLTPDTPPVLSFEGSDITVEEGDTDWVIRLQKTSEEMNLPARTYMYDLVDTTKIETIIKGRFEVI